MSIEDTDRRAAENAVAPRISLADIEASIAFKSFQTAQQFVAQAAVTNNLGKGRVNATLEAFTICVLQLKNGWIVVGTSAPAAPENYKADLGMKLAYEDCVRQIWPLMGFQLRDQLHKAE